MKCPKCKKGEVLGDTFFKDIGLSSRVESISKYYCPKCDFEKEFRMELHWPDYYSMISDKREDFIEAEHDVRFGGILIKPIKKAGK